jgi:hypothetical protein
MTKSEKAFCIVLTSGILRVMSTAEITAREVFQFGSFLHATTYWNVER